MHIDIRPLAEADLGEADRIFRLAFGTFIGMPDPLAFMGDADLVRTRWLAAPGGSLGAYRGGELIGSNLLADWGSFGSFGPLTVRPDAWGQGIARRLMDATMQMFRDRGTRHTGLFTFPNSAKHLALYQAYGFWPQHLTAVMTRPVAAGGTPAASFGDLAAPARAACLAEVRALGDAVFPGLDLRGEIAALAEQGIGETVLLHEDGGLAGFAVCHLGAGSEAGSGAAFVKFGAVRPGPAAARQFTALLAACEALAAAHGLERLTAGVNTARHEAYRIMLAQGFATMLTGVAMQAGNAPGFNRADCFVLDDWR